MQINMSSPTYYSDISSKDLEVQEKYKLTDIQTLMYDHICRGDFRHRNEDAQVFYDENITGFGWGEGRRVWVKQKFKPLINAGLVKFLELHDCMSKKYTSWYFYDANFEFHDLIDSGCNVRTSRLAQIKYYLNLPDGFDKNKKYDDVEFIRTPSRNEKGVYYYSFIYKGEPNIYEWDHRGEGIKLKKIKEPVYYTQFDDLIFDVWSFLAHDGYEYIDPPGYTKKRRFSL